MYKRQVTSTAGWKDGLLLAEYRLFIFVIDHRFYERTSINRCSFNIPYLIQIADSQTDLVTAATNYISNGLVMKSDANGTIYDSKSVVETLSAAAAKLSVCSVC